MNKKTKIGLIQLKITNDIEKNIKNSIIRIKQAAKKVLKLYVFQNYFYPITFVNLRNILILNLLRKYQIQPLKFFVNFR